MTIALHFPMTDALRSVSDWAEAWAKQIYLRLVPDRALSAEPLVVDRWKHGHAYNWADDRVWLDHAGGGVLVARECFGAMPNDGVDIVAHVMPDPGARVLFDEGTDYTQSYVKAILSAETEERCAAVREVVERFFREQGLGAPVPAKWYPRRHR